MNDHSNDDRSDSDLEGRIADCIARADVAGHHVVAAYLDAALNALGRSGGNDPPDRSTFAGR